MQNKTKQKDKLGQAPDVKPIFKIDQAVIIDMFTGHEIDPTVEDFDTVRGNTPADLIHWFIKQYHFSDSCAKIFYSYPGGFNIKNLLQNVAKQSAATKEEIESNNKNVMPFMVQMLIVAEPRNLNQYNLNYWKNLYDEDYSQEYFKNSGKARQ